ncbi:hypothetical protein DY000_02010493 [Brassica cretica]|uniref:Uncharacterized protein n=1 Tax=Brassica cretica TaxID=69181 RepID=A0ABQ7CFK1_BRACR|nr:hypothetical protein DY000_02010493 [Brassica cretica]
MCILCIQKHWWFKKEEDERKDLARTQYSDTVTEVEEEDYLSFLGCFEAWEAAEMIKEEEVQQEEYDVQLNERGELKEDDDPLLNQDNWRKLIGNFSPESRRGTYSFSGRTVYASFTSLVSTGREFVTEFLLDAFILRWVKEEDGRNKLAKTQYSDAVTEVEDEVKSSKIDFRCFEAWKAAEIIKGEVQQEEDNAQPNEPGESEEEDDPPLKEP